ncbi:MAG: hypothetical protein Q9164_005632, partial [Protoblastenia rupestris]
MTIAAGPNFAYQHVRTRNPHTTSAKRLSAGIIQSPLPTAPATLEYKDPNLTGCYAGNGGSKIFTSTSGQALNFPPGNHVLVAEEPQTFTLSCSDLFALGELELPRAVQWPFRKSPACKSYAQEVRDFERNRKFRHSEGLPFTSDTKFYPPGVKNGGIIRPYKCCGGCQFFADEVQVLHWATSSESDCSRTNGTMTSPTTLSAQSSAMQTPASPIQPNESFTIVDGSTLTSPSLYLAFKGTVRAGDLCGGRGKTHTNPTIAVDPSDLSTLSFAGTLLRYWGEMPQTGKYDPTACRTYGLSNGSTFSTIIYENSSSTWSSRVSFTIGPPYNPILLPPKALTQLDPEWEACTSWRTYDNSDNFAVFFGLYDPPRTLTPEAGMVEPTTTPPGSTLQPTFSIPQPAGSGPPKAPKSTAKPENSAGPSVSVDYPKDKTVSKAGIVDYILRPFQQDPTSTGKVFDPADRTGFPRETTSARNSDVTLDTSDLDTPRPTDQHSRTGLKGGDGSLISIRMTAYELPSVMTDTPSSIKLMSPHDSESNQPILTIEGKTHSVNKASQYISESQNLSPGGLPIVINGISYSLPRATTSDPDMTSISSFHASNRKSIFTINGEAYTTDATS